MLKLECEKVEFEGKQGFYFKLTQNIHVDKKGYSHWHIPLKHSPVSQQSFPDEHEIPFGRH